MLLTAVPDVNRFGRVLLDKRGAVTGFMEKKAASGPGLINAGIYLLETDLLVRIPSGRPVSLEKEIIPSWIGWDFYGYQSPGPFIDIGTPESLSMAAHFFIEV
jgi:NDP-sugar pyrophosphorylase family protein